MLHPATLLHSVLAAVPVATKSAACTGYKAAMLAVQMTRLRRRAERMREVDFGVFIVWVVGDWL
jgi:hypothetical protein